jgi:gephyrin
VGVLSTGNEIVPYDLSELNYGQVRDSNRVMLSLLLKQHGCTVKDYGICKDNETELDEKLRTILSECDMVITSGGVSMGDHDFVKPWVEKNGQVLFGRLNMKPGKPTTLGKINDKLVFALPGNPVSCFVTFHLLVARALGYEFPEVQVNLGDA